MECPICNKKFPITAIEAHVEECLVAQDQSLALQVQQQLNRGIDGKSPPPQVQSDLHAARDSVPAQAGIHDQKVANPLPPNYHSNSNQYRPVPNNPNSSSQHSTIAPRPYYVEPPRSQVHPSAQVNTAKLTKILGATQSDVDQYNSKLNTAYQQIEAFQYYIETFAARLFAIEKRQQMQALPPSVPDSSSNINNNLSNGHPTTVSKKHFQPLPSPKYMQIRNQIPPSTSPSPHGQSSPIGSYSASPHQNMPQKPYVNPVMVGPQGQSYSNSGVPKKDDPRAKFFHTYQRYWSNNQHNSFGANSFFQQSHAQGPTGAQQSAQNAHPSPPNRPHLGNSSTSNHPQNKPLPPIPANQPIQAISNVPNSKHPSNRPEEPRTAATDPTLLDSGPKVTDRHIQQLEDKWIRSIEEYPDDALDLIVGHLTMLFNQKLNANGAKLQPSEEGVSHPLSDYVYNLVSTWFEPFGMIKDPTPDTLKQAASVITSCISTLENIVLEYYPRLSTRQLGKKRTQADVQRLVRLEATTRRAVQQAAWPLFYEEIMKLFHMKNAVEDEICNQKLSQYLTMNPGHLGIPRDYWLIDNSIDEMTLENPIATTGSHSRQLSSGSENAELKAALRTNKQTWSTPPYYSAIQTLKELPSILDPEGKLACIVKSAKELVNSVARFHSFFGRNPDKYPVGGDELLPIFTYVVIRSGLKNLPSESTFMETFINDDQARGEQGYILATIQTVIAFVSVLDNTLISQSVDSVFKEIAKDMESKLAASHQLHANVIDNDSSHQSSENESSHPFNSSRNSPSSQDHGPGIELSEIGMDLPKSTAPGLDSSFFVDDPSRMGDQEPHDLHGTESIEMKPMKFPNLRSS